MTTLTMREFRSKLASTLDLTDSGQQVVIRRGQRMYAIVPFDFNELQFSPELELRISKAREEHENGQTLSFDSARTAQQWMDSL